MSFLATSGFLGGTIATSGFGLAGSPVPPTPPAPTPGAVTLPLQSVIPSYVYEQYADDQNIVAFAEAFNALAQGYLTWFNQTAFAVYTGPNIWGDLLDWIGQGIYGIPRPVFSSFSSSFRAGLNALPVNVGAINSGVHTQSGTATIATDDYYKRVLTWWLYAGNGRHFNIELLRQRVARFLYGENGGDITLSQAQTVHILAGSVGSAPKAQTASTAGGTFSARSYGARVTYVTEVGESLPGNGSAITVAANNLLVVNSPPPVNGAIGWYPYVDILATNVGNFRAGINSLPINAIAANGNNDRPATLMTRQSSTVIPIGTNWTEPSSGLVAGLPLPTTDTSNAFGNLVISIPSGTSSTYFKQAFDQGLLAFPFQLSATVVIE